MAFPSPFSNPEYYRQVKIGGRQIKALLVAINGVKIEDEWNEQRSTGTSGATYVFRGTKPAGPVTLTFEAVAEEDFSDLRELYEMMAPKPGFNSMGAGNTQGSAGSATYGRQYVRASSPSSPSADASPSADVLLAQAQAALAALQSGAAAPAVTPTASTPVSILTPGPKPPTLSIENGFCAYVGITAISRKSWELKITPTNSYQVNLEVVPQRPVGPAAVGPAAPKSPDNPGQGTVPLGEIQGPAAAAVAANNTAAQASGL